MIFLYHANCTDGAGAALAAWMKYGDRGSEYIPAQYGTPPPECISGEEVFLLDFSYKRPVLEQMIGQVKHLVLIDHHQTAEADLDGLAADNLTLIFNMRKSGAVLSWEYFFPDKPVPELHLHIQDRDLWRFEMPGTADIVKGLQVFPWREWSQCIYNKTALDLMGHRGASINAFLQQQTEKLINHPPTVFTHTGDTVPVINLPGFMLSDSLHAALEKYPDCPYAVGFIVTPEKTIYSLRSRTGSDVDVSAIALKFGGGGHKHAAGFTTTY